MNKAGFRVLGANWSAHTSFLAVLLAFTLLRLLVAGYLELHFDEAYYWFWAKNPQLSYYDHPPMAAWLMTISTALLGDSELGVRLFAQIGAFVGSLMIFDAAQRAYGDRAAWFAGIAMQATLLVGVGSLLMTPDAPLSFFSIAVLWALVRYCLSPSPYWWLVVGLFGGAALLSKYTAGLIALSIALWLILTPGIRGQFLKPWVWFASIIALIVFSPVLVWNVQHDWISFMKQGGRLNWTKDLRFDTFFEYIGSQAGLVTPVLFVLIMLGVWHMGKRALKTKDPLDVLLVVMFAFPALFFLAQTPFMRVQGNWPAPMWPPALLATAAWLFPKDQPTVHQKTINAALITGFALTAIVWAHALIPAGFCWQKDPVFMMHGKQALTSKMVENAKRQGLNQIVSPEYATAAWLRFYAKGAMPVSHLAEEPRYHGFGAANPPPKAPFLLVSKRAILSSPFRALLVNYSPMSVAIRPYKSCGKEYYVRVATPKPAEQ